ncbi:MAG: hypothetical protein KY476_15430 [Planctomycetes bacterium]|nr:hypothetical protein [Planctomycetota bacterium]
MFPVRAMGLLAVALFVCGCHELQPHRLQRLNRGPDYTQPSLYSVPDPSAAQDAGGPVKDSHVSSRDSILEPDAPTLPADWAVRDAAVRPIGDSTDDR